MHLLIRYILRGYFFPGTAGTCTSSKSHSRASVIIPAYRHIGTGPLVIHFRLCFPSLLTFTQMHPTSMDHRSGRTLTLGVDWEAGATRVRTLAFLMEVLVACIF